MNIKEFVEQVRNGKIDVVDYTEQVLSEIESINKEYHYLNTISYDLARKLAKQVATKKDGQLLGLPLSIKDNICVKGVESTAGSAILKGYKPLFHATAVQKLIDQGAIIIGKNTQDSFGFGSFNMNVGVGMKVPMHPLDSNRVTGGSSGGSCALTKKMNLMHASIGESTGGSIEAPASFCGVVGMCPTYGTVSRYGLIDYANSLDKMGPVTKTVEDANYLWKLMIGKDPLDSTSVDHPDVVSTLKKVGVIREFVKQADREVQQHIAKAEEKLRKSGIEVVDVDLPTTTKYGMQAYYIIAMSEASTNLAKYCGMRYGASEKLEGNFNEYFSKVRSTHLNAETKRRILLGTFARMAGYRDAFYIKAAKVRAKIIAEYQKQFNQCQALLSPTMPIVAPTFDEVGKLTPLQHYAMDLMTVGPNLAGIPHMSVPIGTSKDLPVGAMVMSDHFNEHVMFKCAKIIEDKQ